MGLVQGITAALPILIAAIPQILDAIITTIITLLPMLAEMAPQIILELIKGIISAIPALAAAIPKVIAAIIKIFTTLVPAFLTFGNDLLSGLWNGIVAEIPNFIAKIKDFALSIWQAIKDALGMQHSPSELMAATVGPDLLRGIWKGFNSELPKLETNLASAMQGLAGSFNLGLNGAAAIAGGPVQNDSFAFYAPVYFQGNTAPGGMGEAVKGRRY